MWTNFWFILRSSIALLFSEKGRYLGSPCEDTCNPELQHVLCDSVTGFCECEQFYPVRLGPTKGCAKRKPSISIMCRHGHTGWDIVQQKFQFLPLQPRNSVSNVSIEPRVHGSINMRHALRCSTTQSATAKLAITGSPYRGQAKKSSAPKVMILEPFLDHPPSFFKQSFVCRASVIRFYDRISFSTLNICLHVSK